MPVIREINPAPGIRAGIWQISESSLELMKNLRPGSPDMEYAASIRNESRKRQFMACRALLRQMLLPLQEELSVDPFGKPFLDSGRRQVSLSHTAGFAAVAVSDIFPVGIDIERTQERLGRVKERFLQERETGMLPAGINHDWLTLLWSVKEAVYKLHGRPDIDLRNDIHVHPIDYLCNTGSNGTATLSRPAGKSRVALYFTQVEDHVMTVAWNNNDPTPYHSPSRRGAWGEVIEDRKFI